MSIPAYPLQAHTRDSTPSPVAQQPAPAKPMELYSLNREESKQQPAARLRGGCIPCPDGGCCFIIPCPCCC